MVARKASSLFNVKQGWGRGTLKRTCKKSHSTEHGKSFKALCHHLSAAPLGFQPKKIIENDYLRAEMSTTGTPVPRKVQ